MVGDFEDDDDTLTPPPVKPPSTPPKTAADLDRQALISQGQQIGLLIARVEELTAVISGLEAKLTWIFGSE